MSNLIIRDLVAPEQPISSYETKMIIGGFGKGDITNCEQCTLQADSETGSGASSKDGNDPATDQGTPSVFIIRYDTEWTPVEPAK